MSQFRCEKAALRNGQVAEKKKLLMILALLSLLGMKKDTRQSGRD